MGFNKARTDGRGLGHLVVPEWVEVVLEVDRRAALDSGTEEQIGRRGLLLARKGKNHHIIRATITNNEMRWLKPTAESRGFTFGDNVKAAVCGELPPFVSRITVSTAWPYKRMNTHYRIERLGSWVRPK